MYSGNQNDQWQGKWVFKAFVPLSFQAIMIEQADTLESGVDLFKRNMCKVSEQYLQIKSNSECRHLKKDKIVAGIMRVVSILSTKVLSPST
jgi:hypothetical protein